MFSHEDRLRAVRLYIKLGKRLGLTIRQLESARDLWRLQPLKMEP
jgi:hypothetical protein